MPIRSEDLWGYDNPDNPNYFSERPGDSEFAPGENPNPYTGVVGGAADVPDPSGGGGFDIGGFELPSWLKNMIPGLSDDPASALLIPSWMAAYKQWEDAGKYQDTAKEAAKYGDPFGQENRQYYQDKLKFSYEHPEEFLNDPGHQAKLQSGLGAVSRSNAAKGYLGSGNMLTDLAAYTNNLDNQWLSDERKNLQNLTGAQFDPANAGKFLMQGNEQSINSQNAALQSMFMPFLMKSTQNYLNNNAAGGKSGSTPENPITSGKLVQDVLTGNKDAINKAIDAGTRYVKLPDGSTADLWAMARGGYRTGEPDSMDYPIRTDNGFGYQPGDAPGEGGGSFEGGFPSSGEVGDSFWNEPGNDYTEPPEDFPNIEVNTPEHFDEYLDNELGFFDMDMP